MVMARGPAAPSARPRRNATTSVGVSGPRLRGDDIQPLAFTSAIAFSIMSFIERRNSC
jgi:hypothetical protein